MTTDRTDGTERQEGTNEPFEDPVFNQLVAEQRVLEDQRAVVNSARAALAGAVQLRDQTEVLIEHLESEVAREEAKLREIKGQVSTW